MIISLDAGFWICFCCVGVSFLGFCFFPGFLESYVCLCAACFPGMLAYAAGVFTGNVCWCCWDLDRLGEGRVEEKDFVILWGWDQRKGRHNRFPAA